MQKNPKKESNSLEEGLKVFEWLIAPQSAEEFFADYWEQKHLIVKRSNPGYYSGTFTKDGIIRLLLLLMLFDGKDIDSMLREHCVRYSVNLDVTKYADGARETLNPDGRAYAPTVWKYYKVTRLSS